MADHVWIHRNPGINKKLERSTACSYNWKTRTSNNAKKHGLQAKPSFLQCRDADLWVYEDGRKSKNKKRSKSTCLRKTDNSVNKHPLSTKQQTWFNKQVSLFNMTSSPPLQKLMNVTSVLMFSAENMSTPQQTQDAISRRHAPPSSSGARSEHCVLFLQLL